MFAWSVLTTISHSTYWIVFIRFKRDISTVDSSTDICLWVEHATCGPKIGGSNPTTGTGRVKKMFCVREREREKERENE